MRPTERTFKFANAVLQLSHNLGAGDVIILGHGNTPPFEHEPSPTIQQVWRYAIAPRNNRDAGAVVERLLDNSQLLGGSPAAPAATIGDDFDP